MASTSTLPIPTAVHKFFSKFPLYTYPSQQVVHTPVALLPNNTRASLWVAPPRNSAVGTPADVLSSDVECLKWQAYVALRGVSNVHVRWDGSPDGAGDGRLPSLLTFASESEGGGPQVRGAREIPGWVDEVLGVEDDAFEGYVDAPAKDESRAWVALLEGVVHSALVRLVFRASFEG